MNEGIRYAFLSDYVKEASQEEIIEKLIEHDERGKEIERLNKENNDLRRLYQRTYKHLFEIGNDELARYFQAQIDECPTFYVEPIVDYYEETKRLNTIIKEVREELNIWYENRNGELDDYCFKNRMDTILDKENNDK